MVKQSKIQGTKGDARTVLSTQAGIWSINKQELPND